METRILTANSSNYEGMMVNHRNAKDHQVGGAGASVSVGHHHHQQHHRTLSVVATAPPLPPSSLRPHSTPATLLWLEENYEIAQGVCVPRNTLYLHYVDFCAKHAMTPVNAASFGKIIRQQFPQLTTRRLGTRGQSRYHYYGIAIRESSPYYELVYSKKGLQATEDLRKDQIRQVPSGSGSGGGNSAPTSSASNGGGSRSSTCSTGSTAATAVLATRLPDFPSLRDLCLPPGGMSGGVPEERVSTFIVMYRAHCQRLLDTIIRGSFSEVQTFLLHYWQGMPPHLIGVLGSHIVVNIVGVCDSILYRSVCSILMSSVIRGLPNNLIQLISKFATELDSWLRAALEDLPENLRAVKIDLARHFCHMLRRQSSLNGLFGTVRLALLDQHVTGLLLHDWQQQDVHSAAKGSIQAAISFTVDSNGHHHHGNIKMKRSEMASIHPATVDFIVSFGAEFERLLVEQAPLEAFTEWIESIVDRCILQQRHTSSGRALSTTQTLRQSIRQFLLIWMAFGGRVMRDLTTQTVPSFETFHLLRVMIDDYFLYLVELLHIDDRARELMRNITLDVPPEYLDTDYEGFLTAIFAHFDSPEMAGLDVQQDHSSPIQQQANTGDHQYTTDSNHIHSPGHHHHQVINSTGDYILPSTAVSEAVSNVSNSGEECPSFTSYDYGNIRLPNGYKFSGTGGTTTVQYAGSGVYPATTTSTGNAYYQHSVATASGFGDPPIDYGSNNAPYSTSTATPSYQQYIRRDFAEHCPTAAGFYSSGDQQPAGSYATVDYYGTVYDVASSSSSSSASVYGDLGEQPPSKLNKKSDVAATVAVTASAPQQPNTVARDPVKTPDAVTSTETSPPIGAAVSNFHIAAEPAAFIRS